ncbi:CDP-diacylglycerol--glycerol-3-phosphate 3-phosphatidyltransferase 2 [Tanacetum coccineum]
MPINLFKFTLHHHHQWLRHTITTTAKPKLTSPGACRSPPFTQFKPQSHTINNGFYKLGFRGTRFCSMSMDTTDRDDKRTAQNDRRHHHRHRHLKPPSSKLLTLPTILTIARVAAVPILISTFYMDSRLGTTATTGIFIAAAVTDWLDGYLARRMNLGTAFGAFLDPVADKLMVAATLVLLCTRPPEAAMFGELPWLLTVPSIAIIGREITMSAVREWAASQGSKLSEAVAVNNLGKWKTATQMTALTILLLIRDNSFTEVGLLGATGVGFLYVSAGLAVWSLVVYMKKIWKVMLM